MKGYLYTHDPSLCVFVDLPTVTKQREESFSRPGPPVTSCLKMQGFAPKRNTNQNDAGTGFQQRSRGWTACPGAGLSSAGRTPHVLTSGGRFGDAHQRYRCMCPLTRLGNDYITGQSQQPCFVMIKRDYRGSLGGAGV